MSSWNTICIEGYCRGKEENGKYPCGMKYPTTFCLYNGICPHFLFSDTTERDVAVFVPFGYLFKDKVVSLIESIISKLEWIFWDSLWFNRKKVADYLSSIKVITEEEMKDCPELGKWGTIDEQFPLWLKRALEENMHYRERSK